MKLLRFLAALLLAAASLSARAGSPYPAAVPAITGQDDKSPLATATVYGILLDRGNHLWAATLEGVFRVEGQQCIPLPFPGGVPTPHVRAMLETQDGALWFATESDGLWRRKDGQWTSWRKGAELPVNRVNALAETSDGALWIATSAGVVRLKDGVWTRFDRASGLPHGWVWRVKVFRGAGREEVWVATDGGVAVLDGQVWKTPEPCQGLPTNTINDLLEIGTGAEREIWLSAWKQGVFRWRAGRWINYGSATDQASLVTTSLTATRNPTTGRAQVWCGTYGAGVACFENEAWTLFNKGTALEGMGVYSLCGNPTGRPALWIGSRAAGVLGLNLYGWRRVGAETGLPTSDAICFADQKTAKGHSFWIGTGRGLYRYEGGRWVDELRLPPLRVNTVLPTLEGGTPTLWVGTMNGLMRKDARGLKVFGPADDVPSVQIFGLAWIREGDAEVLWATCELGVIRVEKGQAHFFGTADGLPTKWVNDVHVTAGNRLWIATRGSGVATREGTAWKACNTGLTSGAVNGLLSTKGKDGRTWLWAATGGEGLARLDPAHPESGWACFDSKVLPGTPSGYLYRLTLDGLGRIYASSTQGVLRFRLEEREGVPTPVAVESFNSDDGVPAMSLYSRAHSDLDGRVWIGSLRGGVVLDPAAEPAPEPLARPELEGIRADGARLASLEALSFSPRQKRLVFEYRLISHHRADDVRYRTQLVGVEHEPGPWYAERYRELAGLSPGRYLLRVWAQDHLGRTAEPLDIPFRIQAPLWLKPWAIALYVAAFVGLLILVFYLRGWYLHRRNRELQAMVAKRTEELAEVNEGLRSLNEAHVGTIDELQQALAEVRQLQGIIPICVHCKKIRDDAGYWNQLEAYLAEHSGAKFSHGYCPECADIARKELEEYKARTPRTIFPK